MGRGLQAIVLGQDKGSKGSPNKRIASSWCLRASVTIFPTLKVNSPAWSSMWYLQLRRRRQCWDTFTREALGHLSQGLWGTYRPFQIPITASQPSVPHERALPLSLGRQCFHWHISDSGKGSPGLRALLPLCYTNEPT